MSSNIFDNEEFFKCYKSLRESELNYNALLEQPAMKALLDDLCDKSVLDLGCGYGHNCIDFINRGAKYVLGVDISKKMLEVAESESSDDKIKYLNLDMKDISQINEKFDFVYSSLAFHYIEDFNKLIFDIYNLLNENSTLLFSQEHPLTTASINGGGFNKENDKEVSYTFSNYMQSGKRVTQWFVDGVEKYHRPISEIVTTLANNKFHIINMTEASPSKEAIEKMPGLEKEFIKPSFLIIKAIKK